MGPFDICFDDSGLFLQMWSASITTPRCLSWLVIFNVIELSNCRFLESQNIIVFYNQYTFLNVELFCFHYMCSADKWKENIQNTHACVYLTTELQLLCKCVPVDLFYIYIRPCLLCIFKKNVSENFQYNKIMC